MLAGNGYVTVAASQVVESVGCQTTYHNYTTTYRCQNASSTLPFVINAVKGGIAYSCTANVTVVGCLRACVCVFGLCLPLILYFSILECRVSHRSLRQQNFGPLSQWN